MTHDEMITVIQAHKEGKIIQCKNALLPDWTDCDPAWNFYATEYRVKPTEEPTPQEEVITKEYLQEMIDKSNAAAAAYLALRRQGQHYHFLGQAEAYISILDIMYHIRRDERACPLNEKERQDVIDSIFENYKPK